MTAADAPCRIRPLTSSDPPESLVLLTKSSPSAAQWVPSTSELAQEEIRGFLAEGDSSLCGFIVYRWIASAAEAEILNLVVDRAHRRKGIAALLLREALHAFQNSGVEVVFLEVRESNHPAIRFYEKHGFIASGRRPRYYSSPAESALTMMKKLTDRRD